MNNINGILALVLCGIGWSTGGIFMKNIDASSFTIASLRSLVAFVTLLVLTRKLPSFVVKFDEESDENKKGKINKKATVDLWIGAISYAATMIMFCVANKMTYAANAVLLQYSEPIYIVLLSPLILGEKNSKFDYISVVGVIAGMILFFSDSIFGNQIVNSRIIWGNIIAIISGVTFALTTMFMRKIRGDYSKSSFAISQLITFVACLPFVIKGGMLSGKSILFIILLGVVQMGIPNYMFALGIKKVRALSAVLISMIEPLMNPVWVAIFAREIPTVNCIIGGIIILLFVVGNQIFINKKFAKKNI